MRPRRESLRVGIEEQNRERDRRKFQRQRVEPPSREDQYRRGKDGERPGEADGKRSGGERSVGGARIAAVEFDIGDAVHGHRRGARADHGDDDPQNRTPAGQAAARARSQQCAHQRKWQRENGVLEFDHFEHGADAGLCHDLLRFPPFQRYCFCCGRPSCARTR